MTFCAATHRSFTSPSRCRPSSASFSRFCSSPASSTGWSPGPATMPKIRSGAATPSGCRGPAPQAGAREARSSRDSPVWRDRTGTPTAAGWLPLGGRRDATPATPTEPGLALVSAIPEICLSVRAYFGVLVVALRLLMMRGRPQHVVLHSFRKGSGSLALPHPLRPCGYSAVSVTHP